MRHGVVSSKYMSSSGCFQVDRGIFYDWTADDKPWCALVVWVYIISRGQYQDTAVTYHGREFKLMRGQCILSEAHLCRMSGWTRKRLRVFLARCQKENQIALVSTPMGTVFTIVNYDKWQSPRAGFERVFDEGPTKGPTKGPTLTQSTTDDIANQGPTRGPTKGPTSIEGTKYLRSLVFKKDKEGDSSKKSKGASKTPVITWDVSSLQFSGIDDVTRARLALAYPNADVDRCIEVMRGWLIKRGDNPHKSYWKSLCSIAEDPQNQKKGLGIEQDFYGTKYRISYDSQSEPLFEVPKKRKHPAVPAAIANALEKVSADDDD